ncbi:chromate transporter [Alkalihalophilus lindianensis]|uniref:Chromate transporter n=1 Tax=Alkalihalophilus lindianensis TaxID=1630542 RepID=A0ABU3X9A1_9BACI|nr:chromate transporter [Alkalihalophilus lindianensis]MDV2684450.1 chromate transporter [Alkalihalophilus lindianensis]
MFWKTQLDIFIAFFRSGILGYGGGPSTIPLVHKEVVGHFKWMTDEEFADVLAIGNTLPGPIATKMAGHIGYQVGGIVGLLNAIVATVLPTVVGMIALIGVLSNYRDLSVVAGMTQAVTPVVGIMMIVMTYQFLKQSKKGIGLTQTLVLAVISAVAFELIGIHPALVIGVLLIYGLVMGGKRREEQKEMKKRNVSG